MTISLQPSHGKYPRSTCHLSIAAYTFPIRSVCYFCNFPPSPPFPFRACLMSDRCRSLGTLTPRTHAQTLRQRRRYPRTPSFKGPNSNSVHLPENDDRRYAATLELGLARARERAHVQSFFFGVRSARDPRMRGSPNTDDRCSLFVVRG